MALQDIDLKNALAQYAITKNIDLSVGDAWKLTSGNRTGYRNLDSMTWLDKTVAAPTEAQLIAVHDSWKTAQDTAKVARDNKEASDKINSDSFLSQVSQSISQTDTHLASLASPLTLAQQQRIMSDILDTQKLILKALRANLRRDV